MGQSDSSGNTIDEYSSGKDGIITMLYDFNKNEKYTLTQTAAPRGFVGLRKPLSFVVRDDETVELLYKDGVTHWGDNSEDDKKWAGWKPRSNGITAFIDVYNKPFNFKLVKTDSEDQDIKLGAAHFALYKQQNTTISGYVKNKEPMTDFEDMVTDNGEVDVCGGKSGRSINTGPNGAVFFLTETKAPFNYSKLEEDIVFRISAVGVPTLISDAYNGSIVETEDSFIYTLSVPNTKKNDALSVLTIRKKVAGSFGNKDKRFSFNVSVEGVTSDDGYIWALNGIVSACVWSSVRTALMLVLLPAIPIGCALLIRRRKKSGSY